MAWWNPQILMAFPQFISFHSQFSILNAPFSILLPQISYIHPQFSIFNTSSYIQDQKNGIFDSKSPQNSVILDKMSTSPACTACSFFQVCCPVWHWSDSVVLVHNLTVFGCAFLGVRNQNNQVNGRKAGKVFSCSDKSCPLSPQTMIFLLLVFNSVLLTDSIRYYTILCHYLDLEISGTCLTTQHEPHTVSIWFKSIQRIVTNVAWTNVNLIVGICAEYSWKLKFH